MAFILHLGIAAVPFGSAQTRERLVIGLVLDGPWERDQEYRALLESKVEKALGPGIAEFPPEKRLRGNWSKSSIERALATLMNDPEVDLIITMGVVSSFQAATLKSPSKPIIASRVVGTRFFDIPSRDSSAGVVSGIPNLSYVTLDGLDFQRSLAYFREMRPFSTATVLLSQATRDLTPDLDAVLSGALREQGVQETQVIYVGDSISSALADLRPDTEAVILSLLPQLDLEDYSALLTSLKSRRIPVYSVGGNLLVQLGALGGWGPADMAEDIVARVASNVQQIYSGKDAGELPVKLLTEPRFAINVETANALGIGIRDDWDEALFVVNTLSPGIASPSLAGLDEIPATTTAVSATRQLSPEQVRREQVRISRQIRDGIFRLADFSAFDAISPKVLGTNRVLLQGYAFKMGLRNNIEAAVSRIPGVEEVENRIENLPSSDRDDQLRLALYAALYGESSSLKRYKPKAVRAEAEGVALSGRDFPSGPHPIQILVREGDVALIGRVRTNSDRRTAEILAGKVEGVNSVENYIQVPSK